MATEQTASAYFRIVESSIFRRNGEPIDLCQSLIDLCDAIDNEPDESDWYWLSDGMDCDTGELLVGAYWALTEWHGGQWSVEYRALCTIGRIFKPGMTNGPEPDTGESVAYELIGAHFSKKSIEITTR